MASPGGARRTVLAVPGSSERMLDKARGLAVDALFMDLEDAVAPSAKEDARAIVVAALLAGGYEGRSVAVRMNAWSTPWAAGDIAHVVGAAGQHLDTIVLPKAEGADDVRRLDAALAEAEQACGIPVGGIGIDAQIESALGLVRAEAIATASPRLRSLVFGPADFMASIGMRTLVVGEQPPGYDADAYHYPLMRILVTARAFGLEAIDGPYLAIHDLAGLRTAAERTAALGFDGKWVLHPSQVEIVNAAFTPEPAEFERALAIVRAYEHALSQDGGARGAVMLDDEMIDEASRKLALAIVAKGRAAGLGAGRDGEEEQS